jgi:transformation/transcription domain-associated protein
LCHLLLLGGRAPPKILFAKDSGAVHNLEMCTLYSDRGLLDRGEAVPCRLTRNMTTFFTGFGVEGLYLPTLVVAAAALLHKGGNLGPLLALFFRDDITTWTSRRNTKACEPASDSDCMCVEWWLLLVVTASLDVVAPLGSS